MKIRKSLKWQPTLGISWNFLTTWATYVFHPIRSTPSGDPSFEATVPCRSPGPSRNISCFKVMLEDIWRQQIDAFPAVSRVEGVHVDFMPRFCIGGDLGLVHVLWKKAGITTDGSMMDLDNFEIKICTTSMDVKWILVSSFSRCA